MTALLELSGVEKRFGGVHAVANIDLAIPKGQLTAVIGPNGAGKTTLFNVIAGAIAPTAGSVRFAGADLADVPMHARTRLGLARTFQNLRIVPDLTVLENVLLGADALLPGGMLAHALALPFVRRHTRAALDEANALLVRVGMEHKAREAAGGLAYGEGKLLELARALAAKPRLLLLDEPAAGLPHAESARMAVLIRRIADEGTTVLLVEHNMRLVMAVAERIMVMAGGRAIALGTPEEVRADRAVIEAYLGSDDDA
jgi:branched-chain amino acid transport system ATP-binding protein